MSESKAEWSKRKLFQLEMAPSEDGDSIEVWKLRPAYWAEFPYFELKNPSREQLTAFEDLLLGIRQDTGQSIPREENRFVQFLAAQRSVQPRDGVNAEELIEPGQHKRFEPNERGAYFQLNFRPERSPFGAHFVDGGPETVQPGTNGFPLLSRDIDAEIPDQEIEVNRLHPKPQVRERAPLVISSPGSRLGGTREATEPVYVDVDSIGDAVFRRLEGVRNAQAEKALHIIHEIGHLTVDEGPLAARSPLRGHIIPYQRILNGETSKVETQDVLADPAERFTLEVGLAYGYIINERQYLKSRVAAYQQKLDEKNIRTGDDLRKYLGPAEQPEPDTLGDQTPDASPASISRATTDSAKMRVVVSNGTLELQSLVSDEWQAVATQPAGKLRAGLYSLSQATEADPSKSYAGLTLYADDRFVYQKVGAAVVKHDRSEFSQAPNPGEWQEISYQNSQAMVTEMPALSRARGVTL